MTEFGARMVGWLAFISGAVLFHYWIPDPPLFESFLAALAWGGVCTALERRLH